MTTDLAEKYLQLILTTDGMADFRPDAQTALMTNHFAKKEYREVIEIFRRSSTKAEGEKELLAFEQQLGDSAGNAAKIDALTAEIASLKSDQDQVRTRVAKIVSLLESLD